VAPLNSDTLEIVGAAMQFAAVVVGGLALGEAEPFRRFIKKIVAAVPTKIGFTIIGGLVSTVVVLLTQRFASLPWYAAPPFVLVGIGVSEALEWLAKASDEALRQVLRVMVPVFGVGALLQLIAVATR